MRDEREVPTKFSFSFIHFNCTNSGKILNAYIFEIYILAKNFAVLLILLVLMYCTVFLLINNCNDE
jgi:hypothetical protein